MTTPSVDLTSFNFDKEFLLRAHKLGISTIEDIMNVNLLTLRQNENFTYHWYFELLQFLERQGLIDQFVRKQL
ncbi:MULTISPECIES: hypothetical protein [Sphingobacterium]|uniref:hypothetical protein n=1 Tax=Sphingobacterium TaxID=28453 RepID=UPI0028A15F8E|nr:hypothetical protein [Sphingobacterium sp.]